MLSLSGAPAEFSSVTFFKVFVKDAIEFVKKHPDYTASDLSIEINSEFQTLPGDEEHSVGLEGPDGALVIGALRKGRNFEDTMPDRAWTCYLGL